MFLSSDGLVLIGFHLFVVVFFWVILQDGL